MIDFTNDQALLGKSEAEQVSYKRDIIVREIVHRQRILERKKETINIEMYEADLICNNIATIIKEDMANNSDLNVFSDLDAAEELNNTWLELSSENKQIYAKLAKEVQKSCKESAARVTEIIKTRILGSDPDFSDLIDVTKNEAGTLYLFTYGYKDVQICITIPVFSEANGNNFGDILGGYLAGVKEDPKNPAFNMISHDLNYTVIPTVVKNWYENKQKKNVQPVPPVPPQVPKGNKKKEKRN